ncbi:ABC transporter ATP-binding protein [candidate division KSB1 bacterium]|nr:ABC transporter ATP-binding protein [candidate division KSB1 bacterium]
MKDYFRVLRYVFRYWRHIIPSTVCMILFVLFSAFSLTAIVPLLNVLFSENVPVQISAPVNATQPPPSVQNEAVQKDAILKIKKDVSGIKERTEQRVRVYLSRFSKIDQLKILCIILLIGFLLKNFFAVGQTYYMAAVEQGLIRDLRNDLFLHLHRMSLDFFHGERTGRLISRVTNDVKIVNDSIAAAINSLFRDPLSIAIYVALMIIISWKLTLLVSLLIPVTGWVLSTMGNKLKQDSEIMQNRMADLTSILSETLYGIRVVKAFAMEKFEIKKFLDKNELYRKTVVRMTRIRKLSPALTEYIGLAAGVFVLYFGGAEVLVGKNALSPGMFILFLGCLFSLMAPLKLLGQVYTSTKEGLVAARRVFRILDTPPSITNSEKPIVVNDFNRSIRFKHVSFHYLPGENVLSDISMEVEKGQVVALVGPSGGGKSTLLDLLVRFYDPQTGSIEIDGMDIKRIRLDSLRQLMGIVTQETILFNDTVRNNIAYGMSDIPDELIFNATKAANAHDFILEMPEGYQTTIGDRGMKLSGGQRQRLAIARAILKNPPILIFDEATSSLDTQSELLVQEAIERLLVGRTSLVIAHRLSTVQNANRIIVIDQGHIVQAGTHNELVKATGLYQKLFNMQFRNH